MAHIHPSQPPDARVQSQCQTLPRRQYHTPKSQTFFAPAPVPSGHSILVPGIPSAGPVLRGGSVVRNSTRSNPCGGVVHHKGGAVHDACLPRTLVSDRGGSKGYAAQYALDELLSRKAPRKKRRSPRQGSGCRPLWVRSDVPRVLSPGGRVFVLISRRRGHSSGWLGCNRERRHR